MRAQAEPSPSTAAAPATRSTSRRTGLIGTSWDTVLSVGARGEARTGGHVLYSPTGHILGSRTGQVLGSVGRWCLGPSGGWVPLREAIRSQILRLAGVGPQPPAQPDRSGGGGR